MFATHPTTIHQIGADQIPNYRIENFRIEGRFREHHSDENRRRSYVPCGNLPNVAHRNEGHPSGNRRNGDRRNESLPNESLPNEDRSRAHQSSVHHPNSGDEMSHPRTGNDEDEGNQP